MDLGRLRTNTGLRLTMALISVLAPEHSGCRQGLTGLAGSGGDRSFQRAQSGAGTCCTLSKYALVKQSPQETVSIRRIKFNEYDSKSPQIIEVCSSGGRQNSGAKYALPCFTIFENHIFVE